MPQIFSITEGYKHALRAYGGAINKSDFYKKEDLHGDSRCCNSKILNERKKDDKKSN